MRRSLSERTSFKRKITRTIPIQTTANRQNAALSTGPKTTKGKARTSKNAVRHGLRFELAVLPFEQPDAWDRHREGILLSLMHQRLLHSRVIHSDDTEVKLRVAGASQPKKAHLWAYVGDADFPYVVFDYTANYTAEGPERFLSDYKGYLQADALAQYEGLYGEQIKQVCCWALARRKFVAAVESGDECGKSALELIGKLYAIERELPALLEPSNDRVSQQEARPERRATPADAPAASEAGPGGTEEVAGRREAQGAAEVGIGSVDRLCVEQLGGVGELPGERLSGDRQQPQLSASGHCAR